MGRCREFDENEVLQKAMELFWKQGYEKTSLSDLVEHMGIHRRSLYDTFGDKHTLFLKTIDCYEELIKDELKIRISRAETAKQALQFVFDFVIEAHDDKKWGCLIVNSATEMAIYDKEVEKKTQELFMQIEDVLSEIVRQGQQTGEFSCNYPPEILGEILENTLIGIQVRLKTSVSKDKLYRIVNFFLDLLNK